MLPSISVITPSYNQGIFIEQTIRSVLDQCYPDIEYIVVDGMSTDSTLDVLTQYEGTFQLVREPDRGQTDALNKGIKLATGELVCWLNSDDYFLPNALKTVGTYFVEHPEVHWLTADCLIVDSQGQPIQEPIRTYKKILRNLGPRAGLYFTNAVCQPATFWRRSVHEQIGLLDESLQYTMDYDFWLRLNRLGPPAIINQPVAAFRIHRQSKGGHQYVSQFAEDTQTARRYLGDSFVLWLHKVHNALITKSYSFLK